jgi:hypothetical protein
MVDVDIDDASAGRVRVHNIEGRIDQADLTGFDDGSAWAIGHIIVEDARMEYEVVKRRREREGE